MYIYVYIYIYISNLIILYILQAQKTRNVINIFDSVLWGVNSVAIFFLCKWSS